MKNFPLLIALVLASLSLASQTVTLSGSAAASWLKMVHGIQHKHAITKEEVLNPEEGNLPPSLMDTRMKYDWVEIGSYHYYSRDFGRCFNNITHLYSFTRFDPEGRPRRLYSAKTVSDDPYLTYAADRTPDRRRVGEKHGYTFLFYEDGSGSRILSYKNGIFIFDQTVGGTQLTDINTPNRFRTAWMAVPRMFLTGSFFSPKSIVSPS